MDKASGILIHLEMHPDFPVMDIADAMEIINENAHENADIIWGTSTFESVGEDYVRVSVLFSGVKNIF